MANLETKFLGLAALLIMLLQLYGGLAQVVSALGSGDIVNSFDLI